MSKRKRLTLEERQYLYKLREQGYRIREIGRRLRRPASTISREVKRNKVGSPFLVGMTGLEQARYADEKAKKRRRGSRLRQRLKCHEIRVYVEEKLKGEEGKPLTRWTPELIAGRLPSEHPGLSISHEAIYQWVYEERKDLLKYLPVAGKQKRRKRGNERRSRVHRQPAAPKKSIEQRPEAIKERKDFGDWEGDTLVSKQSKECLLNLAERKSRFIMLEKLEDCTAASASEAKITRLSNVPPKLRRTITLDNGPENAAHAKVDKALNTETYFCHPYTASERGTVENRNGFIRRVFPKKTDFAAVSQEEVRSVEMAHNHRPMKCLGFRTPHEVFWEAFKEACHA